MRILLGTIGSLGDLHPYLAVGRALRARGVEVVVASAPAHGPRIVAAGLSAAPVRPDEPDWLQQPELMAEIMHPRLGTELLIRKYLMPAMRDSAEDFAAALEGIDVVVSHPLTMSLPHQAERRGLPWISSVLAPISMFSAFDPPVIAPAPWLRHLRFLGPVPHRALFALAKKTSRGWLEPVDQLRRELGLPPAAAHPLFEGQYSVRLNLALFSPHFAPPQQDWHTPTVATGFPLYDPPAAEADPVLEDFLAAGEAPIVFTLGSSAVRCANGFYQRSLAAARMLRRRAIFLIGDEAENELGPLEDAFLTRRYLDFGRIFPRAALVVHQGGIGTTAQGLRAGVPALILPFSHDQFDNADRVARLGAGRLGHRAWSPAKLARACADLLARPRPSELGRAIAAENGADTAADAILRAVTQTAH
ncbi:MAG: glycosyltransferase family 1 protein [Verrucomicrobia bacterium]|nr:glycosyltransferase family 1 protein [Verrucomicrobiota bacterium]